MALANARFRFARTIDVGDWVITLVLLAVMVGAYVMSADWPFGTAFFPRLLSAASIVLILLKLVSMVWWLKAAPLARMQARPAPPPVKAKHDKEIVLLADVDEDQGDENELQDVFSQSGARAWLAAFGWLVLLFLGMYLVGLLAILPVFIALYLRFVAKASWRVCLLYVLGTAGLIFVVFDQLLHLPLPQGILFEE